MAKPIFIPWRTFNEILEVLNADPSKHGDEWKTREDHVDMDAALRHERKATDAEHADIDFDSGFRHDTLALCRRILVHERSRLKDG